MPASASYLPTTRQLAWTLFVRVLLVTLFLGGTILYQWRVGTGPYHPILPILYLLVGLFYLQAVAVSLLLRVAALRARLVQVQLAWDLFFITLLVYFSGGIESQLPFLYLLLILGAAFLLRRKETLVVAAASAILYGSLLDLQYYGYLPVFQGLASPLVSDGREVFYAVFVNVVAFILTGLLAGTLAERLRRSEQALRRRQIDVEELELLNRAILRNIGSGLMIVNPAGRIRAFNQAAERITGHTMAQVYNRPVAELFPELVLADPAPREIRRGEAVCRHADGTPLVLGYGTTLLQERSGAAPDLLVSFQDLTLLKQLERRLHQADRLAAIGKLATGLAHEIRNPLASISGSVQLLAEAGRVGPDGERLCGIIVREAERLSDLLTEFLTFARPPAPALQEVDLGALCDEIIEMAQGDARLAEVSFERDWAGAALFRVDRDQFRQVLWNLLLNAGEALEGRGRVRIALAAERGEIVVEDSGPGFADETLGRIFDPFFTTKEQGTGLGLSTVYATVEAHGGTITAGNAEGGGARFVLRLPPPGAAPESTNVRALGARAGGRA